MWFSTLVDRDVGGFLSYFGLFEVLSVVYLHLPCRYFLGFLCVGQLGTEMLRKKDLCTSD